MINVGFLLKKQLAFADVLTLFSPLPQISCYLLDFYSDKKIISIKVLKHFFIELLNTWQQHLMLPMRRHQITRSNLPISS